MQTDYSDTLVILFNFLFIIFFLRISPTNIYIEDLFRKKEVADNNETIEELD